MKYAFDTEDLIKELTADIVEFGNEEVWAYWVIMDNGQDIYFDYYPINDDSIEYEPEYRSVEDFDKKVAETYPNFLRQKMKSLDLLGKFKEENELF